MPRRLTTTLTTTALGLGLALATASPSLAATGSTAGQGGERATGSPSPELCRAIDFEKAQVTPLATTGTSVRYRLTVSGHKPASNVRVTLVPVVYVRQPDFWEITVTGCSSGIGLPVLTPYTASYDFTGPLGRCGIEAVGTTTRQTFDLAGCLS